jgi:GNAT superfamily N-acetyltransferase
MGPGDLDPVFDLQCRAHGPDYHEPRAALASRLERGRGFCLVAELGRRPVAYLLAHPWRGPAPALHRPLATIEAPDHLFLHDLAVLPEARGSGAGAALVSTLVKRTRSAGFGEIRLVAIAGADSFWQRQGWAAVLNAKLDRSYGSAARLMRRPLDRTRAGL